MQCSMQALTNGARTLSCGSAAVKVLNFILTKKGDTNQPAHNASNDCADRSPTSVTLPWQIDIAHQQIAGIGYLLHITVQSARAD